MIIIIAVDKAGHICRALTLAAEDAALQQLMPDEVAFHKLENLPRTEHYWDGSALAARVEYMLLAPSWTAIGETLKLAGLPKDAHIIELNTRTLYAVDDAGQISITPEKAQTLKLCLHGKYKSSVVDVVVHTLTSARASQWAAFKQARAQAQAQLLQTDYGAFDADPTAQQNLCLAASRALLAQGQEADFVTDWTLADNSTVRLDATMLLDVAAQLATQVDAAHQQARRLRTALAQAQTVGEAMALGWADGGLGTPDEKSAEFIQK